MAFTLLTFNQALGKAANYGNKKHLLLGNGFSIACKPDIFTYGSLFEEAKKTMSKELAAIFAAIGTQDFEEVIRALQHAAAIVSVYKPKIHGNAEAFAGRCRQVEKGFDSGRRRTTPCAPQ